MPFCQVKSMGLETDQKLASLRSTLRSLIKNFLATRHHPKEIPRTLDRAKPVLSFIEGRLERAYRNNTHFSQTQRHEAHVKQIESTPSDNPGLAADCGPVGTCLKRHSDSSEPIAIHGQLASRFQKDP